MERIFEKLKGIKNINERILFLLDHLPNNEKGHVEQFIIKKIHAQFAREIKTDEMSTMD